MSDVLESVTKAMTYSVSDLWKDAGDAISGGKESPAAAATPVNTITEENSVEAQAAQRRLARLSKYFTSPTGVMDSATGAQGVF